MAEYAPGSLATLEYGGHNEVGTPNHITTGEDLGICGLKRCLGAGRNPHPAIGMEPDTRRFEPVGGTGQETEGDDHGIGRDDLLGPRYGLGDAPAAGSRRPEPGLDHLHALDPFGADDLDGLAVEQEFNALLLAVLIVAARPGMLFSSRR